MVRTGLQRLVEDELDIIAGRRVGLVTHPAAVLPDCTHSVDALLGAGVNVTALFAPEHGFGGFVADGTSVGDAVDPRTGLPVFSLYGTTKGPTPSMLHNVDVLVFDMQDVGVRFYTFISTLYHVLSSASQANVPIVVLDRPNPIDGVTLEGPLLRPEFVSFVGVASIPARHGLTTGELARYWQTTLFPDVNLTVVAMAGWQRTMWFDETGLPWVPTSPAMPHLSTATVYPGTCLLEGTNVSEGRGTALPFEICGAPWIDGYALARHLNALGLPGVRFRPAEYIPAMSKYAGEVCQGVQIHVVQRDRFRPMTVGLHLIAALLALYPLDFAWLARSWEGTYPHFDLLLGTDAVRETLQAGGSVRDITAAWMDDLHTFAGVSHPHRLYT